jgi:nucleotide-binding universal stress UspA family protein
MISVRTILFPVDFSDRCRGAAHAVRAVARWFDAEVMPLHVIDSAATRSLHENLLHSARQAMDKLIASELTDCRVAPCVTTGDPAVRIVEHALNRRSTLIMMPTHGYGALHRFLLGSVTAKVLHDAACPVWTSAHLESWPVMDKVALRSILCGMDFGPRSSVALQCASQLAEEFHANLTVAHAISLFDTLYEWRSQAAKAAEEKVRRMETELGVNAAVEIVDGSPAFALSEIAERLDADLVVIGRTHIAAKFAKLGTSAYAIIAHSPSPVLSV